MHIHICMHAHMQEGGQQVQQGADMGGAGYDVQYSEDGQWMWNGAEWVPAR